MRSAPVLAAGGGSDGEGTVRPQVSQGRTRVMLLISSLEHGGAQRQLVELARELDREKYEPIICSLSREVPLARAFSGQIPEVFVVPKRWKFDLSVVFAVARLMSRTRVQLVHAFLFDAEMVARLAARLAGVPVVVGSERNSDYKRPWLQRFCLRLTRSQVDAVIANSEAGQRFSASTLGLPRDSVHVVRNGVDVTRFRPQDKAEARRELGLAPEVPWVGMVAAFKPQKNHLMLLEVARRVIAAVPEAHFLCAGEPLTGAARGRLSLRPGTGAHRGVEAYHQQVRDAIRESGFAERIRLLGNVERVDRVYAACDLTVLTSRHEGTPNVLLESMACGVPVVATDVADNAYLVPEGRTGFVVPSGDAEAMAARVEELLSDEQRRRRLGEESRRWVEREFSTTALAERTSAVYERLLRRKGVLPALDEGAAQGGSTVSATPGSAGTSARTSGAPRSSR
jgi:glycosyltransferase involved in cell wall biosynthesis